jgi:copper chaperone
MEKVTLHIDGMSCGHCLNAVNQALGSLPGVKIGLAEIGRASLEFDSESTSSDEIVAAVEEAGYSVTLVDGSA